jgi:hypothetical protein
VTVVFVTRSLQEALILGDRVVVLDVRQPGSRMWWTSRRPDVDDPGYARSRDAHRGDDCGLAHGLRSMDQDRGRPAHAADLDALSSTRHSPPATPHPLVRHESHFTGRGYRLLGHLAHRHQPERRLEVVNPTIMLVGQNLGLRGWGMFSAALLPAALPQTISGLRAGWASGWRTVIAAGLVFGVTGGGPTFFTNDAGDFLPAPELLAGLFTIAGILGEATFRLLERGTVVRWGMKVGRE